MSHKRVRLALFGCSCTCAWDLLIKSTIAIGLGANPSEERARPEDGPDASGNDERKGVQGERKDLVRVQVAVIAHCILDDSIDGSDDDADARDVEEVKQEYSRVAGKGNV